MALDRVKVMDFDTIGDKDIFVKGDEVFRADKAKPCDVCGKLTHYVSISFQAFYCSEECLDKEWALYYEAERR
jgi:hypothetical protein